MRTFLGLASSIGLGIATVYHARGWKKPPPAHILLDRWWVFLPLLIVMILCVFLLDRGD
jgi:hypothetical protein